MRIFEFSYNPVVKRAVVLKFQRTDGMRNSFDRILDRMCEIVHRIDAPGISGSVVCHMSHTVDNRITHVHIRRCHVNTGTKNSGTVLNVT